MAMGVGDELLSSIKSLARRCEAAWRKVVFTKETTEITIDDDKQNSRSRQWEEAGFVMQNDQEELWGYRSHGSFYTHRLCSSNEDCRKE